MWLIVGLGNPGADYAHTRHNVGFMVLDALALQLGVASWQKAFSGLSVKGSLTATPVVLLKPETFMNRSGQSVQAAATFYKVAPEKIVVIHDELDLPFGELRIKEGGGHGGHNGLRDISRALGPNFMRVRVGIGRPAFKGAEADYVLAPYRSEEKSTLEMQIVKAMKAIEDVINEGVAKAQLKHHTKA